MADVPERYYRMVPSFRNHGLRIADPGVFQTETGSLRMGALQFPPRLLLRGLPDFPVAPALIFNRRLGAPPQEVVEAHGYWFVRRAFKQFAEEVDPGAFDFAPCDTSALSIEGECPDYWICDLRRIGDFLDEANSENLKFHEEAPRWRILLPFRETRIAVRRDRLTGDARVFGIPESLEKFCDQHFRDAFKAAKLGPMTFEPN